MPSPRHDAVNQLFRDRPEFAVEILRDLAGVRIPIGVSVRVESNDFNTRPSVDFRPDTVLVAGPPQQPRHGIIVEVQAEKSDPKRKQLPRYAAALWLMIDCPVTLLVICPNERTVPFYAAPFETQLPGYTFTAAVLGPDTVPVITDPSDVAARPEMAALSIMMHGGDRKVCETFLHGLAKLQKDHAAQYYESAHSMAASMVRRVLEELMTSTNWLVSTPFARKHFGEGKIEGKIEGRAEGCAKDIVMVLEARGLMVSDEVRDRVSGCHDLQTLEGWLRRAVVVDRPEEIFHEFG